MRIDVTRPGSGGRHPHNPYDFGPEPLTLTARQPYRVVLSQPAAVKFELLGAGQAAAMERLERLLSEARRTRHLAVAAEAITAAAADRDRAALPRAHLLRGDLHLGGGLHREALADYAAALRLCQPVGNLRCVAEAANNAGLTATHLGEVAAASQHLELARLGWRDLRDAGMEARTLSNLGLLHRRAGDLQKALTRYDEARVILERRGGVPYGLVLNNLALCHIDLNEPARARDYLQKALLIFDAAPSRRDAARARSTLSLAYTHAGQTQLAAPLLEAALAEARQLKDLTLVVDVLLNRALLRLEQRQPLLARTDLDQVRSLLDGTGLAQPRANALHLLGLAAVQNDDWRQAQAFFGEAARFSRARGLRDAAAASLTELALVEHRAGRPAEARQTAEQALALVEAFRRRVPGASLRAAYLMGKRRLTDLLVELATDESEESGWLAAERGRGRALLDALAETSLTIPAELAARRGELQHRYAQLAIAPPRESDADELLAEDARIEARIRDAQTATPLGRPLEALAPLQRFLPPDTALLYFHVGERRSSCWRIEARGFSRRELPDRGVLAPRVKVAVELFHGLADRRASAAKQHAFAQSMREISQILLGGASLPPRLLLVLDGPLLDVPFAALPAPNRPLGLDHDLVLLPSASLLLSGRAPRSHDGFPLSLLAVTDPVFSSQDSRLARSAAPQPGDRFARLPFSFELPAMRAAVARPRLRELRGFDANLPALLAEPLSSFGILHFSTHGWVDTRNPELSGLALSALDRQGRTQPWLWRAAAFGKLPLDGPLVVLSACSSAQGRLVPGEGLAGLTNSLLQAGAAQVLSAQAQLDAQASSEFLAAFYRHLLTGRTPPERALRLARQSIAEQRRWSDPFYWAAFQLSGRPY